MERPPHRNIRLDHELHEPRECDREREPAPKLDGSYTQHGPEMTPEALGRGVFESIGYIRYRETRCLEKV
jgi:hypothetical protein